MNETAINWVVGISIALLFFMLWAIDHQKHRRVENLARKVHGQVVQYGTGGDFYDYMIVLPNGKCWYNPETTEPPK